MFVLPSGFTMPPLPYTLALVGGTIILSALLYAVKPPVTQKTAVALAPWMGVGGAFHAFYQLDAFTDLWAPLFGAPAVYVTTFVFMAAVWLAVTVMSIIAGRRQYASRYLGITGGGVLTVLFVIAVWQGLGLDTIDIVWPSLIFLLTLLITVLIMFAISLWRTTMFIRMRYAGTLIVFAHAFDGVSTAVGADVLGVTERSPLPAAIMNFAGDLPTAEFVGVGWLFVLVKLTLATAIVIAFNEYVDEEPVPGNLLVALIAAVGLGPAVNNVFLFLVGTPA